MRLFAIFAVTCVAIIGAISCGSNRAGTDALTDGLCVGDLAAVRATWGECPDTLVLTADAAVADPAACMPAAHLEIDACGAITKLVIDWGTHSKSCIYGSDGALVGATAGDDVPSYCGNSSYSINAGSAAPSSGCTTVVSRNCGLADAATGGGMVYRLCS
jgi:hypothetical protein